MSVPLHPLSAVLGAVLLALDRELIRLDHGEAVRGVGRIRRWKRTRAGRGVGADSHHEEAKSRRRRGAKGALRG